MSHDHRIKIYRVGAAVVLAWLVLVPHPALAQQHGDIAALRQEALALVNKARKQRQLSPLTLDAKLNQAAQYHADDMFRRHYYAHSSPEGKTVMDRYEKAGGSCWKLVEENIARCEGCPPPPDTQTVARLQDGWMHSPEHRANILREGLASFGFGIAMGKDKRLYGVQTFAGPGTSRGAAGNKSKAIEPARQSEIVLGLINDARRKQGLAAVQVVPDLRQAAKGLLPAPSSPGFTVKRGKLSEALPSGSLTHWRQIGMLVGICGGCGVKPVAADVHYFAENWLKNTDTRRRLLGKHVSGIGLAIAANGAGKKIGVLVVGQAR